MQHSNALLPTLRRRFEHWLFDLPEELGGQALHWPALPLRYLYALLRDLGRGELGLRAMSLVYSTLFAIVPVIAVAFAVLKAFGYHRELEPVLFEFLRPLGEQGYVLTESIMDFVENVQGTILGTVGFAFLLFTVISMIQKTEEALNFVWHVERSRSFGRRVTEYLVVMLVGPALAVVAMVLLARIEASNVLAQLSDLATGGNGAEHRPLAPYLMVVALFAFIYLYVPNTRVRLVPAAVGAVFGGVLWAAVGALFARVVVYATQTAAIYAGFAVVLLFLVWLYLSWLILLLGVAVRSTPLDRCNQRRRLIPGCRDFQHPAATRTHQTHAIVIARDAENEPAIRADKADPSARTLHGLWHAPSLPFATPQLQACESQNIAALETCGFLP